MKFQYVAAVLALSASPASASDLLPLNDGLYVTDARLCSMSLEQMYGAYGDGVAAHTRTVDGTLFSTNYESACQTADVSVDGDRVNYTAVCSGEGEEWSKPEELFVRDKDRFSDASREFVRCESALARETNTPTTLQLITLWHDANTICRGSSDPDAYLSECGKRELLDILLAERGWCYTQPNWSGAQNMWHVCIAELNP